MSESKKPGFFKKLFGFAGREEEVPAPETEERREAKKAEPESPRGKTPSETVSADQAPSDKTPAAKKPAAKKSPAKKPAAKKPAAKGSSSKTSRSKGAAAARPASKTRSGSNATSRSGGARTASTEPGDRSSEVPREGARTGESQPRQDSGEHGEDDQAADMQPKTAPPDPAPAVAPGKEPPEEKPPSRRTEEAPDADDEAGPASPRPTDPDAEPTKRDGEGSPQREAPPAGPGPASDDEEEAGPTAPEPKQFKRAPSPSSGRGWFAQLREGLSRTSNALTENLSAVLTKERLDEDTLDDLEDVLIRADLGLEMAERVRGIIAKNRYDRGASAEAVREVLGQEVTKVLDPVAQPFPEIREKPSVWLVVGVNGTGKTTTIGKLAYRLKSQGNKVMLAAADTFRAAAIDQLKVWGDRTDAQVVAHDVGADPAGVAYDGLKRAQESGADVLLIDTAGRLQNKSDLMDELAKIVRVLKKLDGEAPHGVLLVLDATTGQNALSQVELFQQVAGVTGLVVTKLDGTARGGILVAIAERFGLPVHAIGVGEGIDDLESFEAEDFARAIAGSGRENARAA